MGVPSQTALHGFLDDVAESLKNGLTALDNEVTGKTVLGLRDQLQAVGDSSVEDPLGTYFSTRDSFGLPEYRYNAVNLAGARTDRTDVIKQIVAQVVSSTGGSFASFATYLASLAAPAIHPLSNEIYKIAQGSDIGPLYTFCPNYLARAFDRVYIGTDGSLTDKTTAASNATTGDVSPFVSNGDCLYLISPRKFSRFTVAASTPANVSVAQTLQYWNGNAFTAVSGLTDNTAGFTKSADMTFTLPTDWVRCHKDGGGTAFADLANQYVLRIVRTAVTLGTPPVLTCLLQVPPVIPQVSGGTTHLGVDQPPLAMGRITAANTVVVTVLNAPDLTRFKAPAIRIRWATAPGADVTLTLSYTNQSAANVTQAQSATTSPAALSTPGAATLNGSDTGVQAILSTGWVVSTTAVTGVFFVEVIEVRSLAE